MAEPTDTPGANAGSSDEREPKSEARGPKPEAREHKSEEDGRPSQAHEPGGDALTFRLAVEEDAPALVEFNRSMASETEALELSAETLSAGVRNLLKNPQYGFYVVAEDEGAAGRREAVGSLMVSYEWSDWRDGLFWWIQSVYVRPSHRRRGVYRRLYEFVKRRAAAEPNVRGFRLYVECENRAAQQTYERLGMKESHYIMYEEMK